MSPTTGDEPAPLAPPPPQRLPLRIAIYASAIALLLAAVGVALFGSEGAADGWRRLGHADPGDAGWMLLTVLVGLALNAAIYRLLHVPFDRRSPIGLGEIGALQAASVLLNYLPMQAGLVARAAYLKRTHAIGYRTSVFIVLWFIATAVGVFAVIGGVVLWRGAIDGAALATIGGLLAASAAVIAAIQPAIVRRFPGIEPDAAAWFDRPIAPVAVAVFGVLLLRAGDLLCFAARLYLAARIFGSPIPFDGAVLVAAAGMIVVYLGPLPNGLGLRELVYGWAATAGLAGAMIGDAATAVSVALIDRAAEAAVVIVAGLIALAWLHRKQPRTLAIGDPTRLPGGPPAV